MADNPLIKMILISKKKGNADTRPLRLNGCEDVVR